MPHDSIDPDDLLRHQLDVLRENGVDVPPSDAGAPERLEQLEALVVTGTGDEPSDWPSLEPIAGAAPRVRIDPAQVEDRILAGWIGRCAANTLGKPFETVEWTPGRIRRYLEAADSWPLLDYAPRIPLPEGLPSLREDCAGTTMRGLISYVTRDDDLDYTLLNLLMLERYGLGFTTEDVGRTWLELLPFGKIFTAEAAAYRNLTEGVVVPVTASRHNPYREWIGALIRADVFGLVAPGRPADAAALAFRDARLSHVRNGIYGEMWAAAAIAAAFGADDARDVVVRASAVIPPRSRLAGALRQTVGMRAAGASWDDAIAFARGLGYYYVHTINNAVIIAAALLWGEGDFSRTIGLAVAGAYDTDSNAATVGTIAGVLAGTAGIPQHWIAPLNDSFHSALSGHAEHPLSELAARTAALVPKRAVG
ncbi:MAG: ADP-ribosylglycohydrolase family protein [Protaetiibacter sp.]